MKSYWIYQSPIFIEEFIIENVQAILEEQNYFNYSLKPKEIKHLLMRNPDYLNNADYTIEFLIRSNEYFIGNEPSTKFFPNSKISFKSLQQKLTKSYYLAENRIIRIEDHEENTFSVKKFSYNSDSIVFSYSILMMIVRSEFDNGNPIYNNLHQLIRLFNKYSIQSNFFPINPNSIKLIDDNIEKDLSFFAGIPSGSSNIFQRGIASNGHFIFVLHSDYYLSIFPISIENGGFISPLMCKLNIDSNSEDSSLSFLADKLIVTTPHHNYGFDITSLISIQTESSELTDIQTKDQQLNKKSSFVITDGVVNVFVNEEKEFAVATVKTIDSKRRISKVILHKNANEKLYETYPFNDYMNLLSCPAETNGLVLSFYMKVDSNHILIRQFSLINGCHLKDEILETNINISSITYDSINQMHYVVIDNNGQLILYALNGSISCSCNPSLFGFTISDLENDISFKPKKFSLFSKGLQNNEILKDEREFTFLLSSILLSSIFFKKDIDTFLFVEKESILVLPLFIIEIAQSLQNNDKSKEKDKDKEIVMNYIKLLTLQIFSIFFVINIRHQYKMSNDEEDQSDQIFKNGFQAILLDTLTKLSKIKDHYSMSVISFIFLNLFDLLNFNDAENNYQAILEGLLISSSPTLFKYIIHVLINNSAQMSLLNVITFFNKYIVNNCLLSKVHTNIVSFLICHQRCIINQLHLSMKKEHFSTASLIININYNDCKTDNEALNNFAEYTNFLVNQFSSSISISSSFQEIQKTTIYFLFSNYLQLISGLYKYHEVAQIVTPLLHIAQNSLKDFFDLKKIVLTDNEDAQKILKNIGLAFGAFTGTLIKGGNYSMYDEKYKWLIRPNMNLIEHPNLLYELDNPSTTIDTFIDENVRQFLSPFSSSSSEILQIIYKKWNFHMNKNLMSPLLELDQLFLAVELYHLQLFEEFKNIEIDKLRPALQQMMRVRNAARSILRSNNPTRLIPILDEINDDCVSIGGIDKKRHKKSDANELNNYYSPFDLIVVKCKMLLRLTSKFDNTNISLAPKLLADFVLSSDQPNTLINYISNQRNRLQLTNIGFSLIEASYSLKIDEFFIQIIDATLSIAVDNFDGLSAIIRYDNLHKSEKYITNFLLKALKNIEYPYLSLIAYKLIKSEVLSKETIGKTIESFIPDSIENNKLFSLFYKKFGYISNIFDSQYFLFNDSKSGKKVTLNSLTLFDFNEISENQWYIISEVFLMQNVKKELFQNVLQYFLNTVFSIYLKNLNTLHYISICIYSFYQNCDELYTSKNIKDDFTLLLKSLGNSIITNKNLERANSIVMIFRRILKQSNKSTTLLIEIINSYEAILSDIEVSKTNEFHETMCAIFAILGGFIDIIQPFNPVTFRQNRQYIQRGILYGKKSVIETPINEETKRIDINEYNVYPEPLYPFNCSLFPNYQYIKSFLKYSMNDFTKKVSLIYLNCLSFYLKDSNFVKLITDEDALYLIQKLSYLMNPFDTMKDTQKVISTLLSMKKIECLQNCKFSVMSNKDLNCMTYLSPVLKPMKIKVEIEADKIFEGYYGLIADCPLDNQYPYAIIHSKLGIIYPDSILKSAKEIEPIKSKFLKFTVDTSNQYIILNEESKESHAKIHIPYIDNKIFKFRIFISSFDSCQVKSIKMNSNECEDLSQFILDSVPLPLPIYDPVKMKPIIKYDSNIEYTEDQLKKFACSEKLNQFRSLTSNTSLNEKPLYEMINIKEVLFNFKQADTISEDYFDSIISHVYSKLISQMSTIIMMDLVNDGFGQLLYKFNPFYLIKLFSYLSIPLEFFDHDKILNIEFPFNFNESILKDNSLTTPNQQFNCLEFEMKKCLSIINDINHKDDHFALKSYIENMFNNPLIHTLRNFHLNTKYHDLSIFDSYIMLSIPEDSEIIIVSVPFLSNFNINQVKKYNPNKNESIHFPFILDKSQNDNKNILIEIEQIRFFFKGLCSLSINKYNNHWVFGTSFELLLLLKEYYLNSRDPVFYRKTLIELILINSPYVSIFVSKLLIRFGQDSFFSPSQFKFEYLRSLYLLSSLIKTFPDFVDKNITSFISHENRALNFPILSQLAPFFPEFHQNGFFNEIDKDLKIQIKLNNLNIPQKIECPLEEFMMCMSLIDDNDTIKSCYYDILIIWLSISLFYLENVDLLLSCNHRNQQINIEKEGIFEIKNNKDFNCEFYPYKIHDTFLKDIEMIKIQWPKEKVSSFVSSIPPYVLKNTNFKQLCEFVLSNSSEYCSPSQPRVILLISYIIHRINHLYKIYNSDIPKQHLSSVSYLLPCSEIGQIFLDNVIIRDNPPISFRLNRFEAHRISVEINGNQKMSIIGQVAETMSNFSYVLRQQDSMPWTVQFINEKALDCGGPGRELFSEISSSIIEQTTGLFIICPNGRNKCGRSNRDFYIPFHSNEFSKQLIEMNQQDRILCYRSIGVFIGIVIRIGYYQDLPFAPVVWKSIAGEQINEFDIFSIDQRFHDFISNMKKAKNDDDLFNSIPHPFLWNCENWDGSIVDVNNPTKSKIVQREHIDIYVSNCIKKRIELLVDNITHIRNGFCENIGFYNHVFMNGYLLSFLAQGSNEISTSELKNIFVLVSPLSNTVNFFWEAVDMMNNKQRSLLLKFVTGLTKLPKNDKNFFVRLEIKYDRRDFLPTASTCFNILYLPVYSSPQIAYNMIKIAIESCQTMENF